MKNRKLQIFLSSTYTDLVDLRLSAIEAILAAGHIPATMEQFAPGDETALEVIQRWVTNSDAYILLLGGRYGSIEPKSGKSYTQLEYELATNLKKPLFAMVMSDELLQKRITERGFAKVDERDRQADYRRFKDQVKVKLCTNFSDEKDIRSTIFQKLPEWAQRDDLMGWIRASDAASPNATEELARLSKENAELRSAAVDTNAESFDGVTFDQMVGILKEEKVWNATPPLVSTEATHAGYVFDEFMRRLSNGVEATKGSDDFRLLRRLCEYGLVEVNFRMGITFKLTTLERYFKNRLLTWKSEEKRLEELWSSPNTISLRKFH